MRERYVIMHERIKESPLVKTMSENSSRVSSTARVCYTAAVVASAIIGSENPDLVYSLVSPTMYLLLNGSCPAVNSPFPQVKNGSQFAWNYAKNRAALLGDYLRGIRIQK